MYLNIKLLFFAKNRQNHSVPSRDLRYQAYRKIPQKILRLLVKEGNLPVDLLNRHCSHNGTLVTLQSLFRHCKSRRLKLSYWGKLTTGNTSHISFLKLLFLQGILKLNLQKYHIHILLKIKLFFGKSGLIS